MKWSEIDSRTSGCSDTLNADCPPGFELQQGQCELRTLYQMYASLEGAGVGGLKTGLPPHRDGFSPQQIDLGRYLFAASSGGTRLAGGER